MMKWLLPAALLALSGCGKTSTLDGFKDFKFGLGKEGIEQLGFDCPTDGACTNLEIASALEARESGRGAAAQLSDGDVRRGERAFGQCATCHTINRDEPDGIGPNLYGVAGRAVAASDKGFSYSDALKAKGGKWSLEALDAWVRRPAGFAPGTKDSFSGVSDPQARADLVAYINSQGSNLPLPAPSAVVALPVAKPRMARSQPPAPEYTLFGKSADITPNLKAGKMDSVTVTVALEQAEAIALLKNEYGAPASFEYDNVGGGRSRVTYWLFDNGTSISLVETITEGAFGVSAMMRAEGIDLGGYRRSHTTVRYLDKDATSQLLKQSKGNAIDPDDT